MHMSPRVKAALFSLPVVFSLGWLCLDATLPFVREAWFVVVCCGLTVVPRTVTWRAALFGMSLGIGLAAPALDGSWRELSDDVPVPNPSGDDNPCIDATQTQRATVR